MTKIMLLIENMQHADISHALYADALGALGHEVWAGDVNSIGFDDHGPTCVSGQITGPTPAFGVIPCDPRPGPAIDFDLVWLLNQPQERVARDAWQLLWSWNQRTSFVNDITGLMMLNNKNTLSTVVPTGHLPESLCSTDADTLLKKVLAHPERRWVVKGPNGGCGADVFLISPGDSNVRALLQSMTGNVKARRAMTSVGVGSVHGTHALLQEYVPHAAEKRIAVLDGEVVQAQEKTLPVDDHRGNVAQDAVMRICEVTPDERRLAETMARRLARHGIRFAGIDLSYPYVFEVNLVNPGGLVERFQVGEDPDYLLPLIDRLVPAPVGGR